MIGVKSVANFAKYIIYLVIAAFVFLIGAAGFKGKSSNLLQTTLKPDFSNGMNLITSFLTIYAFTGFQSVVQLSEETVSKDIMPKVLPLVIFAQIYSLLVLSIIFIVGLAAASKNNPVSLAYNKVLGTKGRDVVSVISIITMLSALVILVLGVSRLFHKLAEKKIAPKYLSKLVALDELFKKKKTENFENKDNEDNEDNQNNQEKSNENNNLLSKLGGNAVKGISSYNTEVVKTTKFDKMPIPALVTLFVIAMALTYVKGGVLELVANATNSMLAFIFTVVNLLVIVNYYKSKDLKIEIKNKVINKLFTMYPWYAIIGFIVSLIFLVLSPKFYDMV